jgi:hypothetical protein
MFTACGRSQNCRSIVAELRVADRILDPSQLFGRQLPLARVRRAFVRETGSDDGCDASCRRLREAYEGSREVIRQ